MLAVGAAALGIVLAGSFAWNSFNQQQVNRFSETVQPGVNLHDDFAGGPQKDVYAENNGSLPALVRVRISEYLHLETGETYPELAADDEQGTGWYPHADLTGCAFQGHLYYDWQLGGHKPYMPAAPSARAQGSELTGDYQEPRDVGDLGTVIDYGAALRIAFGAEHNALALADLEEYLAGNGANAERLQAAIAALPGQYVQTGVKQYEGQPEAEQTRLLSEVWLTLVPEAAISMQDWLAGTKYGAPCALGPFWVLDEDGWAYWAQPLQSQQATGQLLQSVAYKGGAPAAMTYKLRAALNAVSLDAPSLNEFATLAKAAGGLTDNGAILLFLASGSYVYGADGELYVNNRNNTFNQLIKNGGSYVNYTLGETLCGGPDGIPGTEDDICAGDTFALNGNGAMVPAGAGTADYTVRSIMTGVNGLAYIETTLDECYLGSAAADGSLTALAQGQKYLFCTSGPDGRLGTADDDARPGVWLALNGQWYMAMGDNTWLLVAGPGSGGAVNEAGEPLTDQAQFIYLCAGADQDLAQTGDNLPMVMGADGARYLKLAMPAPDGAVYYIRLAEGSLAGVDPGETRWPGADERIGTADDTATRWAGDFLPDDFSGQAGETFTADGYEWVVLDTDAEGNRLITTTRSVGNYHFNSTMNTDYASSDLQKALQQEILAKLPTVRSIVQPVSLPPNDLSFVGASTAEAFPLSAPEYTKYQTVLDATWNEGSYWLRSTMNYLPAEEVDIVHPSADSSSGFSLSYDSPTARQWACRPALWVRFPAAKSDVLIDGIYWRSIARSGGSVLLMSRDVFGPAIFRDSNNQYAPGYEGSDLQAAVTEWYNSTVMPTIKQYAQKPGSLAIEADQAGVGGNTGVVDQAALTKPEALTGNENGKDIAFVPSVSEVNSYLSPAERAFAEPWWLRSKYSNARVAGVDDSGAIVSPWPNIGTASGPKFYVRVMIWVDARALAVR